MTTICIQIGNSDDKLTQKEWSTFVLCVKADVAGHGCPVHFSGNSEGDAEWQNYCIVFECDNPIATDSIKRKLTEIKERFRQDSIAWLESETEFV